MTAPTKEKKPSAAKKQESKKAKTTSAPAPEPVVEAKLVAPVKSTPQSDDEDDSDERIEDNKLFMKTRAGMSKLKKQAENVTKKSADNILQEQNKVTAAAKAEPVVE